MGLQQADFVKLIWFFMEFQVAKSNHDVIIDF